MSDIRKSLPIRMTALAVALAAAGCTAGAGEIGGNSPLRCEIESTSANGILTLQGMVYADSAVSGSYRFHVTSHGGGGSSNISQGGGFSAGPGGAAQLGKVMLGNRGATYDVRLEVSAGGHTYQCSEQI